MSDPGYTLPGSIPGLLRRGSPVLLLAKDCADVPCVVISEAPGGRRGFRVGYPWPLDDAWVGDWPPGDLLLDLTDPTGRAHAAWYVSAHHEGSYHDFDAILGDGHYRAICAADSGDEMEAEEIAALRRVVIHLWSSWIRVVRGRS